MMKKKNPRLLFITHDFKTANKAFSVSALLRGKVFRKIGLEVRLFHSQSNRLNFLSDFFKILKFIKKINILYIRVDGSSILEKFSLLKLFNPRLSLIWEIHANVEEAFWGGRRLKAKFVIFKRKLKRKILSKLVDGSICISEEMRTYSKRQLGIERSFIISNFVDRDLIVKILNSRTSQIEALDLFLNNKKIFKVFWGGGARYHWQAINLIEKVAKKIYKFDKEIFFFVVGSDKWHRFTFFKNILSFDSFPHEIFLHFLKTSDVCLTLYYKDNFHFSPLKLLEYMALKKPVIATSVGQIKEVVKNKENGFLTNNSVNDIVQKILFLKKNPRFAQKIGQKAQETVFKNYSLEQAAQRYKSAFKKLNLL